MRKRIKLENLGKIYESKKEKQRRGKRMRGKKECFESNWGITLIALIVTIIVLIILATISVNAIIGEDGIIAKAKAASDKQAEADAKDELTLILSAYPIEKYSNATTLLDYLLQQKTEGKLDEVTDNENGTYTVELKGYEATINASTLAIEDIGKAGLRPQVSNIKITTDGTTEVADNSVTKGTALQITFTHSIVGGTTTVNPTLPYTTNGTETSKTFFVTGTVDGQTYTKNVVVNFAQKYKSENIASTVQVGDFVNYSAGNWTTTDITNLGTLYAGEDLPTSSNGYQFGGFKVGDSKDASITPFEDYANTFSQGWRVLSIDGDTVNIIHAGTPEGYYHGTEAYKSEYILNRNTTSTSVTDDIKSGVTPRDWSMYENTTYAVADSARSVTYDEINAISSSNTLRKTGSCYWLPLQYNWRQLAPSELWR